MFLSDKNNIKEVLLFPAMKPDEEKYPGVFHAARKLAAQARAEEAAASAAKSRREAAAAAARQEAAALAAAARVEAVAAAAPTPASV